MSLIFSSYNLLVKYKLYLQSNNAIIILLSNKRVQSCGGGDGNICVLMPGLLPRALNLLSSEFVEELHFAKIARPPSGTCLYFSRISCPVAPSDVS